MTARVIASVSAARGMVTGEISVRPEGRGMKHRGRRLTPAPGLATLRSMPNVGNPSPTWREETLYLTMAAELAALGALDQFALLAALKHPKRYADLPERLQEVFRRIAAAVK